jgi:hypothetical protein
MPSEAIVNSKAAKYQPFSRGVWLLGSNGYMTMVVGIHMQRVKNTTQKNV